MTNDKRVVCAGRAAGKSKATSGESVKFIRTKIGIYRYVDYDDECIIPMPIIICKGRLTHCAECDIIKKADTIEELCDQFVFVDNFYLHEHRICHSLENAIALSKKHNVDIGTFRGAIWTSEGLQYVAKMNKEGKLELL